jgi:hypothetical protein
MWPVAEAAIDRGSGGGDGASRRRLGREPQERRVKYALKGVQAAPSLADGDGHADLGHVGDGHLEELAQELEAFAVPWGVGHCVIAPAG